MKLFESILGAVEVGGTLLLSPFLRKWYNAWGASKSDLTRPLAGDELVPEWKLGYTRSIIIHAPAERVWQWLVQLGQGRGGMYSYDDLENLVKCDMHSVDRILPELQNLKAGDVIRMGPKGYPTFVVDSLELNRSLVLISANPQTEEPIRYDPNPVKMYSIATWQFTLEPVDAGTTRLITRQRLNYTQDMRVVWRLTEPVAFVMERKMLRTIRKLSEKTGG